MSRLFVCSFNVVGEQNALAAAADAIELLEHPPFLFRGGLNVRVFGVLLIPRESACAVRASTLQAAIGSSASRKTLAATALRKAAAETPPKPPPNPRPPPRALADAAAISNATAASAKTRQVSSS